ncbi:MAG: aldo/keto reductase [Gammaproteobacteria bacterium]|nr:aldo/keto reductase [Pseudomonadales bacterium]MCP5347578.1 aldo/keto reductase [Pseudomonadales bacterium]
MPDPETTFPKRLLGQTGLLVSCLGLGTVKIGRNQGVRYPAGFTLPDDQSVRSLLAVAQDLGINLLDTAPAYGSSEERLGRLLENRGEWILCSKVGEEFRNGQSSFDFSGRQVRASVERSLQRLRTDYLDIVLIHSDGNDLELLEQGDCLEALQRLQQAGLIRAIGMSTKTVAGGLRAVELTDLVMVTYNPLAQDDKPVIEQAAELHKGVLIKKGLLSGHLDQVNQMDQSNRDPVESSLEFIFAQSGVSSVIVGTISTDHLAHNVASVNRVIRQDRSDAAIL